MLLKAFAVVVFMFAAIVALLWVPLELAGAVADGADWIWYLALGVTIVTVILVLLVTARSRSRGMVALTAVAAVMLVGVLLTHPGGVEDCVPGSGEAAVTDTAVEGLQDDALLDDTDVEDAPAADDCA